MKTRRIEIRVTEEFADRLDGARGDVTMTRFVERALEAALGAQEPSSGGEDAAQSKASATTPAPSSKSSDPYQERMVENLRSRR